MPVLCEAEAGGKGEVTEGYSEGWNCLRFVLWPNCSAVKDL